MSKKDYSKDPSGRKQFSIDHIKFHDAEAAQDFFGCAKKYDAPTRAPLAEETIGDIPKRPSENPTAQFIGPFEPDTQPRNDTEACHRSGGKKGKDCGCGKRAAQTYRSTGTDSDPNGSWTGCPHCTDGGGDCASDDRPVQDQDDL